MSDFQSFHNFVECHFFLNNIYLNTSETHVSIICFARLKVCSLVLFLAFCCLMKIFMSRLVNNAVVAWLPVESF